MSRSIQYLTLLITLLPGVAAAATYNLPADITSPPFNCSGSGPYTCGDITLNDNDIVNLSTDITLNLGNDKLDIKKDVTINSSPYTLTVNAKDITIGEGSNVEAELNATGKVDIKKDVTFAGKITAKDISIDKNTSIQGDLIATDKIDVKKDATIVGNMTAEKIDIDKDVNITGDLRADEIKIDKDTTIDGNVFAEDKLDIKKDVTVTGTCPPWEDAACLGATDPMVNPTVNSQITTDTTPIITGTFTSSAAFSLTVSVDSVTYTLGVNSELSNSGDNWTLDLSSITPLANGTYDVDATSSDGSSFFTDTTNGELVIGPLILIDNFLIDVGSGAANACSPFPITITARDSSNNTVTDYAGTVSITTSTSNGSFAAGSPAPTNNLNPNPDNDDNGSVGYTFDPADTGEINLTIENPRIESLTITVNDATASVSSTSATVDFAEVGFEIIDNDSDIAGSNIVVAGRDHDIRITALRLDPVNGCGTATGYDGLKDLKLWRTQNAADPSTVDPTLAGGNLPNAEGAGTTQVTFNSGVADVLLDTADIGKYRINAADRNGSFTAADIIGTSAEMTVRPFGLAVTNITAGVTTNPGASAASGAVFTSAGSPFNATVSAVLWRAANDSDNDGVLDTGSFNDNVANPTPGYDWDSPWTISSFTPATGTVGALSDADFSQGSFTAGAQTVSTVEYDEVGSFTFQSNGINYLGTTGVDIESDVVTAGRFVPASFSAAVTLDGAFDEACGAFTYLGQEFNYASNPQFFVTALDAGGNPTGNYRDAFAKLGSAGITIDVSADGSNGLAVAFISNARTVTARNDNSGIVDITLGNDTLRYGPDAPLGSFSKADASEIIPFVADISPLVSTVNDGEVSTNVGLALSPTGNNQRFGRLNMTNVNGSELNDLDMPVITEYLDPNGFFVRNLSDTCTSIVTSDLLLTNNLNGGSSTVSVLQDPASAGDIGYRFTAPGDGNDGYIDVVTDLSNAPWLRYDWDADGEHDEDPSARATFGIFRGNDVQIYMQQIYP